MLGSHWGRQQAHASAEPALCIAAGPALLVHAAALRDHLARRQSGTALTGVVITPQIRSSVPRIAQSSQADSHAATFQALSVLFLFKRRLVYGVLFFSLFGNAPAEHLPGCYDNYQVAPSFCLELRLPARKPMH